MTRMSIILHGCILLFQLSTSPQSLADDINVKNMQMMLEGGEVSPPEPPLPPKKRGRDLYEKRCGACHSLDQNRIGPLHRGVFGREAGTVPNFRYTKALKNADIIWNDESLDRWLKKPTDIVPGTSMGFQLANKEERTAIIEYLKSVTKK